MSRKEQSKTKMSLSRPELCEEGRENLRSFEEDPLRYYKRITSLSWDEMFRQVLSLQVVKKYEKLKE